MNEWMNERMNRWDLWEFNARIRIEMRNLRVQAIPLFLANGNDNPTRHDTFPAAHTSLEATHVCFTLSLPCHSLSKLNIKFAKTWTLFSNNVNTTIRKYSLRAFIWVVTPSLDSSGFRSFLGLVKFTFGSGRVNRAEHSVVMRHWPFGKSI